MQIRGGVYRVLAILPGATKQELRELEYKLINHYKSELNILKEDNGKVTNDLGTPVIVLNIITWEENIFPSIAGAARFIKIPRQSVEWAAKNHKITPDIFLVMYLLR